MQMLLSWVKTHECRDLEVDWAMQPAHEPVTYGVGPLFINILLEYILYLDISGGGH
jgi:hypothetical protein